MKAVLFGSCLVSLGLVAVFTAPIRLDEPFNGIPTNLETKEEVLKKVADYLKNYGYLIASNKYKRTDKTFRKALKKYQSVFGLDVTGEVNEETLELMGAPRCGVSDSNSLILNKQSRFATYGKGWTQKKIAYALDGKCNNRSIEFLRDAVVRAFKIWSSVVPLEFYETSPSKSLFLISCRKRQHGDNAPFDGPGGVIAHAYPPPYGNTHFDDDELWTDNSTGKSLHQVATHELGHALGMDHSTEFHAIMYPYYVYRKNFTIHQDDIDGIQSLYGSRN